MLAALGRFTLLVRDYDEALAFYRDVLGFDVLHDSVASNGQRFVHIGMPGQGAGSPGFGLWLLTPGSEADRALIGRQAGHQPLLVLYTTNCAATATSLEQRGVKFRRPPRADGGTVFAHFEDLYGNEIVLVEMARA
jgi:catechol 2,3-dioxygenase-like lactoylglutathione lyase family enzyme